MVLVKSDEKNAKSDPGMGTRESQTWILPNLVQGRNTTTSFLYMGIGNVTGWGCMFWRGAVSRAT